jgi:hypothetical protein
VDYKENHAYILPTVAEQRPACSISDFRQQFLEILPVAQGVEVFVLLYVCGVM